MQESHSACARALDSCCALAHDLDRSLAAALAIGVTMPVILANGIEIAYDDRGSQTDPAILLIMGLGTQMIAWPEAFCDDLAVRGFRVVRFDNRDIGLSTKFDAAPPIDLGAVLQRVMAGEKINPPYDLTDMAADA